MSYDVDAMKKEIPSDRINFKKPWLNSNPQLGELLKFGSISELARAVFAEEIPEPWRTIAVMNLPMEVLVVEGLGFALEEGRKKK